MWNGNVEAEVGAGWCIIYLKARQRRWYNERESFRKIYSRRPRDCRAIFLGTRILVVDVLSQLAMGIEWEKIGKKWWGKVTNGAIAEAVRLAGRVFIDHTREYVAEAISA